MMYTLKNHGNGKYLTHPAVGLWFSESREEAEDMLETCRAYLRAAGLLDLVDRVEVVEIDA